MSASASTSNIEPTIRELQEELYCVKDRCQDIGIQLGLDDDALRQIEESYPDSSNQLRHVLRLWLGKGDASWSKLVTVLRHPVIDEKEMADKLESRYCPVLKTSPAPSQECIVLEDPPTPDNAPSSSTTANDEQIVDLQSYNSKYFARSPHPDRLCVKCKQVPKEPMTSACCHNLYCKTCSSSKTFCFVHNKRMRYTLDNLLKKQISRLIVRCFHCEDSGKMQAKHLCAHLSVCPNRDADAVVDSSTCSVQSELSLSPIPLMTPLSHSPLPISVSMSRVSLKGRTGRKRSLASESDDSIIGSPARKVINLGGHSETVMSNITSSSDSKDHLKIPFPYRSLGCKENVLNTSHSEHVPKGELDSLDQGKQAMITLSELNSRLVSLENQVSVQCTPPQFFLVREVSKHVTATSGWISPSFYSHQFGCKLHLVLWLSSSQSILNLEIVHDEGVNDDVLKWPCKGKVTIKIVNQVNDSSHCRKELKFEFNRITGSLLSSHAFPVTEETYMPKGVMCLKVVSVSVES